MRAHSGQDNPGSMNPDRLLQPWRAAPAGAEPNARSARGAPASSARQHGEGDPNELRGHNHDFDHGSPPSFSRMTDRGATVNAGVSSSWSTAAAGAAPAPAPPARGDPGRGRD